MHRIVGLVVVVSLSACIPLPPERPHVTRRNAVAQIDPGEREKAFSRALGVAQAQGWIVAVSDRAGGLLTTQSMTTGVKPCGALMCDSRSTLQVTIAETGVVTVNLHREFWLNTGFAASSRWFVPSYETDVMAIEEEQARVLAEILGRPLPPPGSGVVTPETTAQ
jgi:hypothetical protein